MMNDEELLAAMKEAVADTAAREVAAVLDRLVAYWGEPDAVIAGALAHVVARMTVELGGDAAVQAVAQIVRQVSGLPSAGAMALATAPPAGRA